MDQILESHIEGTLCNSAKDAGWFVRKLQWIGVKGAPDRLFIKDGRVVFIEFKRPKGTPNGRQKREAELMLSHGAEVYAVDSLIEAVRILEL